jgi:hypothetical protein
MASTNFSFNVISQEEYDARRKEEAVAATTAALPAQPPRRFSVAIGVAGVLPKLKKKSDSLSSTHLASTLRIVPNALVTIPVLTVPLFAMFDSSSFRNVACNNSLFISYDIFFAGIPFWHVVLEFAVFAIFRFFSNQRIRL